jgi:hypothetical protein
MIPFTAMNRTPRDPVEETGATPRVAGKPWVS